MRLRREILLLAIPAALQNLLMTVQFLVDTKMVAEFAGEDPAPLAALGVSGPVCWSISVIATFTSVAATALVARRIGEGSAAEARSVTATASVMALVLGGVVSVAGWLGAVPLIEAITSLREESMDPTVVGGAADYVFWIAVLFPARSLAVTLSACFRGAGDTARPLWAGVFGNVLNVFANWVFIFGALGAPAMGAAGAGLATALAGVGEFLLLTVFLRGKGPLAGPLRDFIGYSKRWARSLFDVGWPALLEGIVFHAGFIVYQLAVFRLTEEAIAAHRVAITWQSLAFMPAAGFYVSAASLTGRLLGQGDPALAHRAAILNLRYGLVSMMPVVAIFLIWPAWLASGFSDTPEVWPLAATALQIGAIEIPFLLTTEALRGALRGAGETRGPLVVAGLGTWLIRVPLSWILSDTLGMGLAGIWWATIVDWMLRSAGLAYLFVKGRWKEVRI